MWATHVCGFKGLLTNHIVHTQQHMEILNTKVQGSNRPVDIGVRQLPQHGCVRVGALIDDEEQGHADCDGESRADAQEHGTQERRHVHQPVQFRNLQHSTQLLLSQFNVPPNVSMV